MGGRLSKPRGPGGMTEASTAVGPATPPRRAPFNARTVLFPVGIITIGCIFFVYSRTTIAAAKENARRSREADGGSISWRNENARRHGLLAKPEERTILGQLRAGKKDDSKEDDDSTAKPKRTPLHGDSNPIEEGIRRAKEQSAKRAREERN